MSTAGEKADAFKRIYAEYAVAMAYASSILNSKGMDSEEFRKADAAAGDLWVKLRALKGMSGKHWMA